MTSLARPSSSSKRRDSNTPKELTKWLSDWTNAPPEEEEAAVSNKDDTTTTPQAANESTPPEAAESEPRQEQHPLVQAARPAAAVNHGSDHHTHQQHQEQQSVNTDGDTILHHFENEGITIVSAPAIIKQQQPKPAEPVITLTRSELDGILQNERNQVQAMVQDMLQKQERSGLINSNPPLVEKEDAAVAQKSGIYDAEELKNLVDTRLSAKEAEEEEWHSPFGESVYTLLYIYEFQSQSFVYSLFVYAIQMATIALTLADVARNDIPPMVSMTVTFAQAVTVFMLLAYMSDLIEAVLKLQDGHYPEVLATHPGATYETWLISCLAQLSAGLLLLVASFVLTMQSATVVDLMLNLTALLFMAEIDDIGFGMAKMGFVTDKLQREAEDVVDLKVPRRERNNLSRRVLYFIALIGLSGGFGWLKHRQLMGYYLSTYIYVQFGDAYNEKIPYFSGILTSGNVRTLRHRQYRDLGTEKILLGYCTNEKAWTFSEGNDPCEYFAKSFETSTFDVTSLHDSQWEVKDSIDRLQPFDSFSLVSRDCTTKTCQGTCGSDGLCKCPHDRFGMDCEFSKNVCSEIEIDPRFKAFPPVFLQTGQAFEDSDRWSINSEFSKLVNSQSGEFVRVYNMPVYYSAGTWPANIIFFAGRRWIMTSEFDLFNLTRAREENPEQWFFPQKTVETLEKSFHGYFRASYTPFFISDPVDFETPDFQATPVGLKWWTVSQPNGTARDFRPDTPVDGTVFVCDEKVASCLDQPLGFCGKTGECNNVTGKCDCQDADEYGDRCELQVACYEQFWPCNGFGVCDESSGVCRCFPPHYGKLCETHYFCFEEGGQCQNGGECNLESGYCDCPDDPAIHGAACEFVADCDVFGCANGGVCARNGRCVCRPPFYGAHCDLVDETMEGFFCSTNEDCVNGKCNLETKICDCGEPYLYGTLCEHEFNCTSDLQCLNNSTCDSFEGICECKENYFGPDCGSFKKCEEDVDCGSDTCNQESGFCECYFGPSGGKFCEKELHCFSDEDCFGDGSSCSTNGFCKCTNGFYGDTCESLISGVYDPYLDFHFEDLLKNITQCGFNDTNCDACLEEDPPLYCDEADQNLRIP